MTRTDTDTARARRDRVAAAAEYDANRAYQASEMAQEQIYWAEEARPHADDARELALRARREAEELYQAIDVIAQLERDGAVSSIIGALHTFVEEKAVKVKESAEKAVACSERATKA